MQIAVDIDGTLCWSNESVFFDECNTRLRLNIDESTLARLTAKEAFYSLPEVQAARVEHPYLEDELAWIEFRERCILASLPLDDSTAGVAKLSELGDVVYYTARYCEEPELKREIEQSTFKWLERHGFIKSSNVVFCNRIHGKVREIVQAAGQDYIVLVDDSYLRVLEEIEQLPACEYNLLRERVLLVAIRAHKEDLPPTDLSIVALPYWGNVEDVIGRIQAHGRKIETVQTTRDPAST